MATRSMTIQILGRLALLLLGIIVTIGILKVAIGSGVLVHARRRGGTL